jgi:RsiW-degrading membrane proteinase PrsW (M82 family)
VTLVAATGGFALSLAIVVALVYLLVLRLIDLNEQEGLWALAAALLLGAAAGALLPLVVSSETLTLSTFRGALADEIAKFIALSVAFVLFEGISRLRGWSEVNGLMDGIIYGAAVGLGFSVGEAFYRELLFSGLSDILGVDPFDVLWTTLLFGLREGLFGAFIGAGFGLALQARTLLARLGYALAGLAVAVGLHAVYVLLAGPVSGTEGKVRTWLFLLLPLLFVAALIVFALGREKSAIAAELGPEVTEGVATDRDLDLLAHPAARRAAYFRLLRRGDFDGWAALRALHNRLVQLALVKRRAAAQTDPELRAAANEEAQNLRASALALRQQFDARVEGATAETAA